MKECEVIQDLLPLYIDGVTSEESDKWIHTHLQTCKRCQEQLKVMQMQLSISKTATVKNSAEETKIAILKRLKRKSVRKGILIAVFSGLVASLIYVGVFNIEFVIPYEEGMIEIKQNGESLRIDVKKDYYTFYTCEETIVKNGVEQNIAIIYLTDTLWSKMSKKKVDLKQLGMDISEGYDAIYYGQIKDVTQKALNEAPTIEDISDDAMRIWGK